MTNDKPILLLGLAAAAGFFLGRWTAPDGTVINVAPQPLGDDGFPVPTPLGDGGPITEPLPLPPLGDAEPGTYAGRWEQLPYEVEVYPQDADETRISPPIGVADASVANDCSIIAVAKGWWDRAGETAETTIANGVTQRDAVAQRVLRSLLTGCDKAYTEATISLRAELDRRLREILPDVMTPPPVPLTLRNPARAPARLRRAKLQLPAMPARRRLRLLPAARRGRRSRSTI